MKNRLHLLLFLLLLWSCSSSQERNVDRIFDKWNHSDTPGVAVAVMKDGEIVLKKGYGSANLEYGIPVTASTIFHIASVSKQFTAFAALMLESEGKLSMDDDIRKYLPEVPDFGKTITLRHLATHTSGLRDQWNLLALAGWRLDDVITKEQIFKLVSKQRDLNFDPGEEFLYCNTGFTLLAEIVARVSGQTFAEFCSERIFQPLQMDYTLFYDDHEKIVPNRAYSYHPDSSGYKKSVLNYANVGATSLFTTVEDLSKWAKNFSNPQVGDQIIIDKLNTLALLNNGETFGGAMGQFVGEYKGILEISHGGADAGYRSFFARYPDQNLAVSVFSNDASFESGKFAHLVADLFLENIMEKRTAGSPESTIPETLKPEAWVKHLGDYELKSGDILYITEENDQLFVQATGEDTYPLMPISHTRFKLEEFDIILEFPEETDSLSQTVKVFYSENDSEEGRRTQPFDAKSVDLTEFVGNYYSEELSTAYQFQIIDSNLVASHSRHHEIYFTPIKKDRFSGDTWFFGKAEFFRDSTGEVEGVVASSGRIRNLKFRKTN